MEERLQANDYKGGWETCTFSRLRDGMVQEMREYFGHWSKREDYDARRELPDIANYCMMLWERMSLS
jgi:hypothetical protein